MDFEKLFKFGVEYFSDYFRVFVLTLKKPDIYFIPIDKPSEKNLGKANIKKHGDKTDKKINPGLFGFVLISILIGTAIGSLTRGIKYSFDFASVIVLIVSWFFYCFIFYLICKILRGKGTFIETLSVGLQVFGVVYVLSNFAEFIWRMLLAYMPLRSFLEGLDTQYFYGQPFFSQPIVIYFLIQFILVAIYLPLAGIHLHEFNKNRRVFAFFLFVLVILLNAGILLYLARVGFGILCNMNQYMSGDICQ